jgi:hypothetical protein
MACPEGWRQRRTDETESGYTDNVLKIEMNMSAVKNVEGLADGEVAVTGEVGDMVRLPMMRGVQARTQSYHCRPETDNTIVA